MPIDVKLVLYDEFIIGRACSLSNRRQPAQSTGHGGVDQQGVREQGVDIADVAPVDPDLVDVVDEVLDRVLVIQDHDRFLAILARRPTVQKIISYLVQ